MFFSEQSEAAVDGLAQAQDSRLQITGTVGKDALFSFFTWFNSFSHTIYPLFLSFLICDVTFGTTRKISVEIAYLV